MPDKLALACVYGVHYAWPEDMVDRSVGEDKFFVCKDCVEDYDNRVGFDTE